MADRRAVLIVGGGGAFGMRAAELLARIDHCDVFIGGRDVARCEAAASAIAARSMGTRPRLITAVEIDATAVTAQALSTLGSPIVLNASGPYQGTQPALARACINAGCHYVDLADDRAFVTGIGALDAAAKARGVLVVSGASTVPAISAAVIDHLRPRFSRLRSVTYGISPGNSFDPGLATVQSILSTIGKPFETRINGRTARVHGWQGLRRQQFGTLGMRWLASCDVPDLALFPTRYPEIATLQFGAGAEVALFHFGMWGVSWLARAGLVRNPVRLAGLLLAMKRWLRSLGSDAGGMAMEFAGTGPDGQPLTIRWVLVARSGHGPMIPATPAVIVVRKLLDGRLAGTTGARPCLDLVSLADVEGELAEFDMTFNETNGDRPI